MEKIKNKITFVGAGPGNPDLITRAGWRELSKAEIILHDALIDFEGFHKSSPHAKWINVGKRANQISIKQNFIGKLLVNFFQQGYKVVRLKGGDSSVFGRISEEIQDLRKNNIPFKIIPGVTAACSTAADLSISLTKRNVSRTVSIITPAVSMGSLKDNKWVNTVMHSDTSVIYMAGKDRQRIATLLINKGMSPLCPVALVESAGSKKCYKRILTLQNLMKQDYLDLQGPVCIIVGEVLKDSNLYEKLPKEMQSDLFAEQFSEIKKISYGK